MATFSVWNPIGPHSYSASSFSQPTNRFIGSKKDVASFEAYRSSGPIVKLIPKSSGSGSVIAVVDDPNYAEVIEPAMHEFSVAAPLAIEPDGVFLLQGGVVHFSLLESGVDSDGKVSKNGKAKVTLNELIDG